MVSREDALIDADIVVYFLPETRTQLIYSLLIGLNILKRSKIINAGRGSLINETELLNSIKSGRISNATLDVFNKEPLPRDHPFGKMKITVTPHIAAVSRPDTCVNSIVSNIIRYNSGEKLLGTVNLKKDIKPIGTYNNLIQGSKIILPLSTIPCCP